MFLLRQIERFTFTCKLWHLAAALFAVMIFKTGIWAYPSQDMFLRIARDPFVNPFTHPNDHYLLWNWLGPFVAWWIGATDATSYFLLNLALALAFTGLFVRLAILRLADRQARLALVFFFVLPVSATPYFWVGYDSLTLFLMVLALYWPRRPAVVFAIGVALGLQHFEQGLFASGGLLLARLLARRQGHDDRAPLESIGFPLALLGGVVVGKLALFAVFAQAGVVVNSGRFVWLVAHLDSMLLNFASSWFFVVYAIFGIGWLLALSYLDRGRQAWPFFAGLLSILCLLPVVEDSTRVFAITAFPLICAFWLLDDGFLASFTDRAVAVVLGVWLCVPWLWAWGGVPQLGVFFYDVQYLAHAVTGWPELPGDLRLWPFRAP
jgi:hypothetical protein